MLLISSVHTQDHAAGHGWWRVSSVAEPPNTGPNSSANSYGFWNGIGYLRSLVGGELTRIRTTPSKHLPLLPSVSSLCCRGIFMPPPQINAVNPITPQACSAIVML